MTNLLRSTVFVLGLFMPLLVWSTHNRAGEITYTQLDDLTIECVVTTYTKESSTNADRDSIFVSWGDGTFSILFRENGPGDQGESLGNDIKKNIYRGQHTYPGRGTYTIGMQDPNRVADVVNVPNSVNVKFFISTTLTLLNSQFQGKNSSAILLEDPIDFGCIGQTFVHNPNAYDPDDDSLAFELVVPFQGRDTTIKDYQFPYEVLPGPLNVMTLNPLNGELRWTFPPREGEFNIAIRINEYRKGVLINSIIRDMQIQILACTNRPPVITAPSEICVVAGELVEFDVIAQDLNLPPDNVILTATGGPLSFVTSNAVFDVNPGYNPSPLTGKFSWQTTCDHIREQYYLVVFKAEDLPQTFPPLTDLHTTRIKVVAPPPENLTGRAAQEEIILEWDKPYTCEDARDDHFFGFSIWRRIGSKDVQRDTCNPGLDGQGYNLINYQYQDSLNGKYIFRDEGVVKGRTYCYRVLAEFARTSSGGYPYNFVQSLTSDEVCLQLSRDQPLILNVDVTETSQTNGEIFIRWTKPIASELDTIKRPGPYTYQLYRRVSGTGNYQAVTGARFVANNWSSQVDTNWTDQQLNTEGNSYEYYVDFTYGTVDSFTRSEPATSVYLTTGYSDQQIFLNWSERVPWDNVYYDILMDIGNGMFDTIGQTSDTFFLVDNLVNGETYCFKILAYGDYGLADLNFLLLNHSQYACNVPIDTVPPCSPELTVTNPCDDEEDISEEDFYNVVRWNDPAFLCDRSGDVASYVIYFKGNSDSTFVAIDTVPYGNEFSYTHYTGAEAAGCYAVTAVDTNGNMSALNNIQCVDNCPLYELPNTFTPNGNGQNDLFKPRRKRFIHHVEFEVFNKWGQMVFKTEDADLNWNGQNLSGQPLEDGTYFYKCVVFESQSTGVVRQDLILKGYIDLLRN